MSFQYNFISGEINSFLNACRELLNNKRKFGINPIIDRINSHKKVHEWNTPKFMVLKSKWHFNRGQLLGY